MNIDAIIQNQQLKEITVQYDAPNVIKKEVHVRLEFSDDKGNKTIFKGQLHGTVTDITETIV